MHHQRTNEAQTQFIGEPRALCTARNCREAPRRVTYGPGPEVFLPFDSDFPLAADGGLRGLCDTHSEWFRSLHPDRVLRVEVIA